MAIRTWNHKNYNIVLDGVALTDFNGDLTVQADSDFWEFVEGQNGAVERSLLDNHLLTVTMPMMATSPQLSTLADLDYNDRNNGAGPFTFVAFRTDGEYKIVGQATIMSIAHPNRSKSAPVRNVVLKVVADMQNLGV